MYIWLLTQQQFLIQKKYGTVLFCAEPEQVYFLDYIQTEKY